MITCFRLLIYLINGTFERRPRATEDKRHQFQQIDDPPNKPFENDRVLGASQSSARSLLTTKYKILQITQFYISVENSNFSRKVVYRSQKQTREEHFSVLINMSIIFPNYQKNFLKSSQEILGRKQFLTVDQQVP